MPRTPMDAKPNSIFRLRKHADYQRVYKASRKQFAKQMSYFFALRPQLGSDGTPLRDADASSPRVGLTVGKVMGKAVDRNRIKRRMREAVRRNLATLNTPVDVILHPRRSVIDLDFPALEREVATVFRMIQKMADRRPASEPAGQPGRQREDRSDKRISAASR
ncbi:ribonuclease P protein component [Tunturibacter empetritectus]|uniref:Ribonuclease P protein component n=1 Tax=Tunturiibacter empetritectus TaxID=3069691 RepID=A0AAU7ZGR1_9BACT